MTPAEKFILFCIHVAAASLIVSFVTLRFAANILPVCIVNNVLYISSVLFFFIGTVDQLFVYPYYRSPLRHLPTFTVWKLGPLINESPRGKTMLDWMQQFPDAEMIRMLGPFNVPMIVLSGANSLREVLNVRTYEFEKSRSMSAFLARFIGHGLSLSEGNEHKVQHKALMPCFRIRKIRDHYGFMWHKTSILLGELQRDIDQHPAVDDSKRGKIEVAEWASRFTLDIIGHVAMSCDFQSLTNKDSEIAAAYLKILDPSSKSIFHLAALHIVFPEWMVRRLPWSVNKLIDTESGFLRHLCHKVVLEKKQEIFKGEKLAEDDILSSIIETGQFSDDQIIDQMLTFLGVGHASTASALAWSLYLCARYPIVQEKLRAEIRAKIPCSDSPINHSVLSSMPYLNGVCRETLRLYPTVPRLTRESVVDTVIAGVSIPKYTILALIPRAINRHSKFWGNTAAQFIPERWIDARDDGTLHANNHGGAKTNFAEISFLHGPRSCIGRDFAMAELHCSMAGIIGKFQLELQNPEVELISSGIITTMPVDGMNLLMKPVAGW